MKALTLHQPWASLVAAGVKTIETRAWSTSYRGPLAIHAAKQKLGDGALNVGRFTNVTGEPIAQGQPAMLGPEGLLVCPSIGSTSTSRHVASTAPIGIVPRGHRPAPLALARGHQQLWDWKGMP